MNTPSILFPCCGLALAALMLSGCSDSPVPTHPVEGVVTHQGKPVDGGRVVFDMATEAEDGKRYTARGRIDSEGRYRLSTFDENDGAVAGHYRVAVTGKEPEWKNEEEAPPPTLPLEFGSFDTSGVECDVKEGSNELNIELP